MFRRQRKSSERENTERVSVKPKSCFGIYYLVKKGFGTAWKFSEDARIGLGTSGNFRREKPEMFRSCRNRFCCFSLMKTTIPEMFRNMPRIILEGAGNVLGPSRNFREHPCFVEACWRVVGGKVVSGHGGVPLGSPLSFNLC